MAGRARNFFFNSFTWSAALTILTFILYGYYHYKAHHNFDFYEGGSITATMFFSALNLVLLIKLLTMDDQDLGKLYPDKAAIIIGITFAIFYGGTDVAKAFFKLYTPPPVPATTETH